MKTLLLSNSLFLLLGFLGVLFQHQDVTIANEEPQLEFQAAADRSEFVPGEQMTLKLIVINHGKTPVYLSRNVSSCMFWSGYFDIQVLDEKGYDVRPLGCASHHLPMSAAEIMQDMKDPKQWVLLRPNEIYGNAEAFWVPKNKGTYHIKAVLAGPVLGTDQEQFLLQNHMFFVQHRLVAPIVPITIK